LDELSDGLSLWDKLHNELQATEDRIPPIHDQFSILEKYEVVIEEEVSYRSFCRLSRATLKLFFNFE